MKTEKYKLMPVTKTILPNQNFADVVSGSYKSLEGWFDVALANGMSITSELIVDSTLSIPELKFQFVKAMEPLSSAVKQQQFAKVLAMQCLADIAIQESGSLEAWFDLALTNGLKITDQLQPDIFIKKVGIIDKQVTKLFVLESKKPASDTRSIISKRIGGIGYMQINNDFKVS